jgi:diguanylate cyclase (GGDEF)-like protein
MMILKKTWVFSTKKLKRYLGQEDGPAIFLFPVITILILIIIWGTTLNFIRVGNIAAENAAVTSSRELAETYEAQVVRALREIDQTLKFVRYAYEPKGRQDVLQELKAKDLLPLGLVFVVSIIDSNGNVLASTDPSAMTNVSDRDFFRNQRQADAFVAGRPQQSPVSGEWKLYFSRRLNASDGKFSGIVMISVDAAYFVSGYESSQLGEHGVLGILGSDGVFRARRSGETVSAGDTVNYAAVAAMSAAENEATLSSNVWDGVRRYTTVRRIYDFPLTIIVGLSEDEQLAAMRRNKHVYLWRASAASLLLILIVAVLGRMSRQLALIRLREVKEQIAHAKRVEYLAYHDGLTMLPNRSLFSTLLIQSLSQARRYDRQLAVLFLDLDHFKQINDTLGHEAGDRLLQEVAVRLKACLRASDTVARLGGDEFVALLPELDEEKYVATVAQKILSALARPYILLGQECHVTASIGISTYPQDGLDEQTLTKNADIAMYQAKKEGKNNFQFYSARLNASSIEQLTLESSLRHALEQSEFQLYYQIKRDTDSGKITGMEALLRWQHPNLGTVAPMRFIPLAEETGLIVSIGKWVLMTACLQNVAWQNQGLSPLVMAVNLTARQFYDENLLPDLAAILKASGMDAHLLELEMTEDLLMRDPPKTMRILTGLKEMGIRIAIDNFGIGYASLSALKPFLLDTIKIDSSFTRSLTGGSEENNSIDAVIAIGKTLSSIVIAQGIETKEQAEYLRQSACDKLQGFYVGMPMPADQISALLLTQSNIAGSEPREAGGPALR